MAIDGIGAMLGLGAPLATKATEKTDKPQSPADVAKARAEASALRQKSDLDAVREKGIYAWAQEQKLAKLREQIEAQMKKEASEGTSVKGSDPAVWSKDETSFEAEVARRMQQALEEAMKSESKKAQTEGRPPGPMIIDISV
jgi:hypothetical protein